MLKSKKAQVNKILFGLITLAICIVIYLYFTRYVNTDVIEECKGVCADTCTFPDVLVTNSCVEGGQEKQDKVCCLKWEDQEPEEPEPEIPEQPNQPSPLPEDRTCVQEGFTNPDPTNSELNFKCLAANKVTFCNTHLNKVIDQPYNDSCDDYESSSEIYQKCCTNPEISSQVQPNIQIKLGVDTLIANSKDLYVGTDYNFYITTTGHNTKCKIQIITTNNYELITQGNFAAFNQESSENCENKHIPLTPMETDRQYLHIDAAILRVVLLNQNEEVILTKTVDLILKSTIV